MKKVILFMLIVTGVTSIAFCQSTSRDNYAGNWEDAPSWTVGGVPPATVQLGDLDLTINGYITRTGNVDVDVNTETKDFIINDTLVIVEGNLDFGHNGAELVIASGGVLIVIGDFSNQNNHIITNNGIFVVSGTMTFPTNDSETYDDSGGGELFSAGTVSGNSDASGANNWGQLDDLYPKIYDFVICGGYPSCALPVKLAYFEAELHTDMVELKWVTTTEENFQKFIVQRSSNGIDFVGLGEVVGKGFNIYDIESKYSFEDKDPLTGFNYYRLKAVNLDDTFEYFGVEAVKVTAPKKMVVYPNPSSGDFISYSTNFSPSEADRIVLLDHLGIEILNAEATAAQNGISLQDKLRPGIYLLRYISNDFEQTTRVLIQN